MTDKRKFRALFNPSGPCTAGPSNFTVFYFCKKEKWRQNACHIGLIGITPIRSLDHAPMLLPIFGVRSAYLRSRAGRVGWSTCARLAPWNTGKIGCNNNSPTVIIIRSWNWQFSGSTDLFIGGCPCLSLGILEILKVMSFIPPAGMRSVPVTNVSSFFWCFSGSFSAKSQKCLRRKNLWN